MNLALEHVPRNGAADQGGCDVVEEARQHEHQDQQHHAALPVVRQQCRHRIRNPALLEMPGQQRKPHQQQEQVAERDPLMRHVVAEAAEAGAVFEAGEDELVDDDDGKARSARPEASCGGTARHPSSVSANRMKSTGIPNTRMGSITTPRMAGRIREVTEMAAGNVRYFSAFSQPAISVTATLACCSSLPMVKKPWNWPGKCRYVTGTPASFNRAAYSAPSSRKGSAPAVST